MPLVKAEKPVPARTIDLEGVLSSGGNLVLSCSEDVVDPAAWVITSTC